MDALKSIVDDIYEMFSDSLHTEEAKDIMISNLRTKFLSLKVRLEETQNHSSKSVQTHSVTTQTEHGASYQYNGVFVERPREDKSGRWWVCACGRQDCPTCKAEMASICNCRQARVSCLRGASKGYCMVHSKAQRHIPRVRFDVPEKDNEEDKQKPVRRSQTRPDQTSSILFKEDDNPQLVKMVCDPVSSITGKCSWYVFLLHPAISASGVLGRKGNPLACGIISLVFAHNITLTPFQFMAWTGNSQACQLANGLHDIIKASISEGIQTYDLNYGKQILELGIADTVLITSDLGYQIKSQEHFETMVQEMLVHYCVNLDYGQTLLYVREENYKVISIVCRLFKGNKEIIVYDPQYHDYLELSTRQRNKYGVFLCYGMCEVSFVVEILSQIDLYCGPLEGPCSIAVLDKKL